MKTVSLELAKQLKEAGYSQKDSYFYWMDNTSEWSLQNKHPIAMGMYYEHIIASPTADEILEQLPAMLVIEKIKYFLVIEKYPHSNHFEITYAGENDEGLPSSGFVTRDNVLAYAAAKMWLYLKKEGLL